MLSSYSYAMIAPAYFSGPRLLRRHPWVSLPPDTPPKRMAKQGLKTTGGSLPGVGDLRCVGNVRFGSKADIGGHQINVRFTPKSGHRFRMLGCPLCAKNRHSMT